MVERLEAAACDMAGVEHAVAVSNGTVALALALELLGVGPGDEVITSPLTFAATLNAIIQAGARAIFVDVTDDFTIGADGVAGALGPATRVVMPVHLYGLPADMPGIVRSVQGRDVAIVEDAAQAHGACVGGTRVGSFGVGCFSLYATKNVSAGEGGLITTNDAALADRARVLRNQGMRTKYEYVEPGHNYRLTELQAAVAIPDIETLGERNDARRRHAAMLTEGLTGVPGLVLPRVPEGRDPVWHQYTVRVGPSARLDRDGLAAALARAGVETGVHYPRVVFDYECYAKHPLVGARAVPVAEAMAREVLSLPVHERLSEADVETVVAAVTDALVTAR
jgi:dTDP-4-amino-4,6-dideoxygalactose transaminase